MALSVYLDREITMRKSALGIGEKFKNAGLGLKDALTVIDVTLEEQLDVASAGWLSGTFEGLSELIGKTVHGTTIERFKPQPKGEFFHRFEIHTAGRQVLGYLNMIYLSKPIPCYYLVYVEVLPPFRGRGLGNKILETFRAFVEGKGAVGILDNIIPRDEPTFDIYTKLGWKPIEALVGGGVNNGEGHYMVFIPGSLTISDLRGKVIRLLFKIREKRPVIDMHENESMVRRTIEEFRSVCDALERLFHTELSRRTSTPLMRFMFTRLVTKVLGFRRRITSLLGYTGGESLEQLSFSDDIRMVPIQAYSLWGSKGGEPEIWGSEDIIQTLPSALKSAPTVYIEALPLYQRPYLSAWMARKGTEPRSDLTIGDLLELGFDPTRLREDRLGGLDYVFERISPHFLGSVEWKKEFLSMISEPFSRVRFRHAAVLTNPPLVFFRDRGNIYVLHKKIEGIHSEEALDQLKTSSSLKNLNSTVGIDRAILSTIREIKAWLVKHYEPHVNGKIEDLTFFVPWDLDQNRPKVTVDADGISLGSLWVA